ASSSIRQDGIRFGMHGTRRVCLRDKSYRNPMEPIPAVGSFGSFEVLQRLLPSHEHSSGPFGLVNWLFSEELVKRIDWLGGLGFDVLLIHATGSNVAEVTKDNDSYNLILLKVAEVGSIM
ncbi:Hypothetical predicted protein, partial [Pelobates cultripes]